MIDLTGIAYGGELPNAAGQLFANDHVRLVVFATWIADRDDGGARL